MHDIAIIDYFRNICSKNYHTVTELEFQPYKENSGREPLPGNVHQVGSGFVRQKPITFPTDANVIFLFKFLLLACIFFTNHKLKPLKMNFSNNNSCSKGISDYIKQK